MRVRQRDAWSGEPGTIERIARRVSGYCGYGQAPSRRASDRALRRFAVEHLDRAAGALLAALKDSPSLERELLTTLARGIEAARDGLRRATPEWAGFLDGSTSAARLDLDELCAVDEAIVDSSLALSITIEVGDYRADDLAGELRVLERALRARRDAL